MHHNVPKTVNDVLHEINKQDAKWGQQSHAPLKWLGILTEEVGEVAECCLDLEHCGSYEEIGACDLRRREELIQVAAVAIQAASRIAP